MNSREEPVPRHSVKLAGAEQGHRIRAGECRIVYGIGKEEKQILIRYFRRRREACRWPRPRMKGKRNPSPQPF
jgi:mRNA-degrading endonuclease RelE of RelBE toxin-antitoxin system